MDEREERESHRLTTSCWPSFWWSLLYCKLAQLTSVQQRRRKDAPTPLHLFSLSLSGQTAWLTRGAGLELTGKSEDGCAWKEAFCICDSRFNSCLFWITSSMLFLAARPTLTMSQSIPYHTNVHTFIRTNAYTHTHTRAHAKPTLKAWTYEHRMYVQAWNKWP